MILIADSGSTKTDWILCDSKGKTIESVSTIGMNPFFITSGDIYDALDESPLSKYVKDICQVHFYGAGCSNIRKNNWIANELGDFFIKGDINVYSDIEGAVNAVSQGEKCIVCILGTGSSFRIYDGKNIIKKYSSLAYIMGDEGSGTHIAKALLRKVFYQQLPKELNDAFFKQFPITKDELLKNVYQATFPNRYLATFTQFCSAHIDHEVVEDIVKNSFQDYAKNHLIPLDEIKDYPVHFVGSIAFHFKDQLQEVAKQEGFTVGSIVKKPLKLLTEYHLAEI